MRWKGAAYKKQPREGDTRTRVKFLWLPTYFGGYGYWLEKVRMIETYRIFRGHMEGPTPWWELTHLERL